MINTLEKRPYRKLGFTALESAEIVKKMNDLLANYHVHYQKLRNFHWNVIGPDFFELHEKFEDQYNQTKKSIDAIAERIRVFGQTPTRTLKEYLKVSEITEVEESITSKQMVEETLKDFQILLSCMVDVIDVAQENGDVGTVDMMNEFINKMETSHWMFTAWSRTENYN